MNIDPELLKQSAKMFSNMNGSELNNMKNMASNMNYNPYNQQTNNNMNYNYNKTNNNFQNQEINNTPEKVSQFPKVEKLKSKGNEFFKSKNYDEASTSYFEVKKKKYIKRIIL